MIKTKTNYTSGEAARILAINPRTARLYLSRGRIKGTRHPITGTWSVSRQDLTAFMSENDLEPSSFGIPTRILIVGSDVHEIGLLTGVLDQIHGNLSIDSSSVSCEALIKLGSFKPNLILLNSQIPGINDQEVLQAIKNDRQDEQTKVLIFTDRPEDVQLLLALGADVVFVKPVNEQQLLAKLVQILPGSSENSMLKPSVKQLEKFTYSEDFSEKAE